MNKKQATFDPEDLSTVFSVKINDREFKIDKINPVMNEIFKDLYIFYFGNDSDLAERISWNSFNQRFHTYFSEEYLGPFSLDYLFPNFGVLWVKLSNHYHKAHHLLKNINQVIRDWEVQNKKWIHKGTLYYLRGMSSLYYNNIEDGFLLLHQASEEDYKLFGNQYYKYSAYSFITLNFQNEKQLFLSKLIDIRSFIEEKIVKYQQSRQMTLTLEKFREKFLNRPELRLKTFSFVFETFHLYKLIMEHRSPDLRKNPLGALIEIKSLFSYCLLLETLMKPKIEIEKGPKTLFKMLEVLYDVRRPFNENKSNLNAFKEINNDSSRDVVMNKILTGNYEYNGNRIESIEEDFMIVYGIRNFRAHQIEILSSINEYSSEVFQRVLNTIFFVIENFYH